MELLDRYRGALLGLAVGDALGTTLEFQPPGSFKPIIDMIGGGPFRLPPGYWTDDTSMALCLAESLIECQGFNANDQMQRYVRWWRDGHLSSTGHCFDIGITIGSALRKFSRTGDPFSGSTDASRSGNGSLMRLVPVPLYFAQNPAEAIARSAESSRTTHGSRMAIDSCRYFSALILGALFSDDKATLLQSHYCPVAHYWQQEPLDPAVDEIADGSFKEKNPPAIKGSGFVIKCLEASLWAFHHSTSFEDGCLLAVNLGDDADTTGAVYGQLAGAYYGLDGIPGRWLDRLARYDVIEGLADRLYEMRG